MGKANGTKSPGKQIGMGSREKTEEWPCLTLNKQSRSVGICRSMDIDKQVRRGFREMLALLSLCCHNEARRETPAESQDGRKGMKMEMEA